MCFCARVCAYEHARGRASDRALMPLPLPAPPAPPATSSPPAGHRRRLLRAVWRVQRLADCGRHICAVRRGGGRARGGFVWAGAFHARASRAVFTPSRHTPSSPPPDTHTLFTPSRHTHPLHPRLTSSPSAPRQRVHGSRHLCFHPSHRAARLQHHVSSAVPPQRSAEPAGSGCTTAACLSAPPAPPPPRTPLRPPSLPPPSAPTHDPPTRARRYGELLVNMDWTLRQSVGGGGGGGGMPPLGGMLGSLLGGGGGGGFKGQEPVMSANYAFDLNFKFDL